jgi:glucose-fructose oxidoreductase
MRRGKSQRKVRYAVVGLGHIAQVAVLPAFAHARRNSTLAALVSTRPEKLSKLARKYDVDSVWTDAEYDRCLRSGEIDAVYVALPNHLHCNYAVRAAEAGIHVLCEKPLALSEQDCLRMIDACERHDVRLMTAYRLHFERANLEVIEQAHSGRIGALRMFESTFSMQVTDRDNIRLRRETGGGPLWDIGIYCINAARNLFRSEPLEVLATTATADEGRFTEVEEMASAIVRFPGDRLATFSCSFGAADVSEYRIVGTEGDLRLEPAYEYAFALRHVLTIGGRKREREFRKRDQFAPELLYFSDCVLEGNEPEPSGWEGLADVRVIRAIYRSAQTRSPVRLSRFEKHARPSLEQEIHAPPVDKPRTIDTRSPSGE